MAAQNNAMNNQTEHTRTVYNRRARGFARMERMELRFTGKLRERQWAKVSEAADILEVGAGAGASFEFYPPGARITAIDLGEAMIELARAKVKRLGRHDIDIRVMDVEQLDFPDNSFDAVVSTFVFCSVPDTALGLSEISRVLKPGGAAVFLEHVRSANRVIGRLMDVMDPVMHRYGGMHINRRTVENVKKSQLEIISVEDVAMRGIVKLITAKKV